MTILLSCLPSAITIMLVYLITRRLTGKDRPAIIASAILLASAVFLTQSTILEEYALATMFLTLAYYFYLCNRKALVAVSLGFATAVHIVPAIIALLWLFICRKEWREWVRVIPLYVIFGILPYGLILYLMTTDAPQLLAGGLSLQSLNNYLGSSNVAFSLSIADLPKRLLQFVSICLMSFGLAWLPARLALKSPRSMEIKLLIVAVFFPIFYYFTCIDPTTWTFLTFASPFIAVGAGYGLSKIEFGALAKSVVAFTFTLLFINSAMLNANVLAQENPKAVTYYNAVWEIPDGSVVVISRGGFEAMAVFYALSEGKELIPVYLYVRSGKDTLYDNYLGWMQEEYGLEGYDTQDMTADALDKGYDVYIVDNILSKWTPAFEVEPSGVQFFNLVKGVDTEVEIPVENR